jgi:hypothetical protein
MFEGRKAITDDRQQRARFREFTASGTRRPRPDTGRAEMAASERLFVA